MDPSAHATPPPSLRACPTCRAVYRAEFTRCPTDGAVIDVMDHDPLVGARLADHYVIEAYVGEGAIARVYRAHHRRLEHRVFAIKVMLGDWATTLSMRMRFAQEAETASRLSHPNVVPVVDFGRTDEGLLYLAMEFVEGRTLANLIDDGPIVADRTIALARQMCLGLAYAHEQGLVHRDFKPDNVLVVQTPRGEVPRIADFGLAISDDLDRDVRLTAVGIAVGTPIYAAPEQTSEDAPVDHRADLFSLGVTLYEMLAGRAPFDGNLVQLLRQNAAGGAPSIAERSGVSVPEGLEQIVRTLMSPDPDKRFPSALAVVDALDRLGDPDAIAATAPPRRSKRLALIVATGALGAGLAAAAIGRAPSETPSRIDQATPDQVVTAAAPIELPRAQVSIDEPARQPIPAPDQEPAPDPVDAPDSRVPPAQTAMVEQRPRARAVARATPTASPAAMTQGADVAPPDRAPLPALPDAAVTSAPSNSAPPASPPADDRVEPIEAPPVATPRPVLLPPALEVSGLKATGSLPSSVVRRAIARIEPGIEACYIKAASSLAADTVQVSLVVDEAGGVGRVQLSGGASAAAASCTADALRRARTITAPDVGTVKVTFTLAMRRVAR